MPVWKTQKLQMSSQRAFCPLQIYSDVLHRLCDSLFKVQNPVFLFVCLFGLCNQHYYKLEPLMASDRALLALFFRPLATRLYSVSKTAHSAVRPSLLPVSLICIAQEQWRPERCGPHYNN